MQCSFRASIPKAQHSGNFVIGPLLGDFRGTNLARPKIAPPNNGAAMGWHSSPLLSIGCSRHVHTHPDRRRGPGRRASRRDPAQARSRRSADVGRRRKPAALSTSAAVEEISGRAARARPPADPPRGALRANMPWICAWVSRPSASIARAQRVEVADGVALRIRQAACWPPAAGRGCCRCPAPNWPASITCARSPTSTGCAPNSAGRRAVIVGGGYIGLEVAATCREAGPRRHRARSGRPRHEPRGLAGGVAASTRPSTRGMACRSIAGARVQRAGVCGAESAAPQRVARRAPGRRP